MLIPVERGAFLPLVLASFVLGLAMSALYDVLRVRRLALRMTSEKPAGESFFVRHRERIDAVLCFIEDVLFCLTAGIVLILLDFKLYHGVPRWYAPAAALGGFFLWRATIGRIVMAFAGAFLRGLRAAIRFVRRRILLPFGRAVARGLSHIRSAFARRISDRRDRAYTRRREAEMVVEASSLAPAPGTLPDEGKL